MLQAAVGKIESTLGRSPTAIELADELGVTVEFVQSIEALRAASEMVDLDAGDGESAAELADVDAPSPVSLMEQAEGMAAVRTAVDHLAGKYHAHVLRRYYFEGATLDCIAAELGKTKPRIHQIRQAAEAILQQDPTLRLAWAALCGVAV